MMKRSKRKWTSFRFTFPVKLTLDPIQNVGGHPSFIPAVILTRKVISVDIFKASWVGILANDYCFPLFSSCRGHQGNSHTFFGLLTTFTFL